MNIFSTIPMNTSDQFLLHKRFINFRDFGGYCTNDNRRVKLNKIYRSGSLSKLRSKDFAVFKNLGIKAICDLRSIGEQKKAPTRLPTDLNIRIIHLPIATYEYFESFTFKKTISFLLGKMDPIDGIDFLKKTYQRFVIDCKAELLTIFNILLFQENSPLIIHCSAGKDRTGYACALIHFALGVTIDDVYLDYQRSDLYLQKVKEKAITKARIIRPLSDPTAAIVPFFESRIEYLESALKHMEQVNGSIDAYIRNGIGVSDYHIKKLKGDFLE